MKPFALLLVAIGIQCSLAQAGVISTRSDLTTQLGVNAITEDFESWSGIVLSPSGFATLNSSTIVNEQGPGIVNSGLLFSNINSNRDWNELQLDRRTEYGISSGALLAEGGTLVMDFSSPLSHFGLDLFQFAGFSDSATVRVYASDDISLLYSGGFLSAPDAPTGTFFGYSDASGIGRVTLRSTSQVWSPLIDNLTYGTVPEPSSFAVFAPFGFALAALTKRRR